MVIAFNLVGQLSLRLLPLVTGHAFTTRAAAPQSDKLWGTLAGAAAAFLVYAVAVRFGEKRQTVELALPPLPLELLIGLAVGAVTMAAVVAGLWLFDWVTIMPQPVTGIARALRDSIQAGAMEELLIRLIIFRLLWRAFGVWPALAIASSFFGIIHITNPGGNWLGALSIIAGEGVGFGLYLLTGRIWASIGAHAAWNFTQGWLFGAIVSGFTSIAGGPMRLQPNPGAADFLTGGSFGPEASLSSFAVSMLASFLVLGLAWRRQHLRAEGEQTGS
ncbi:MAG: CPBP family intramembrane glutamic endopeptidase [Croceibacterium sp.]